MAQTCPSPWNLTSKTLCSRVKDMEEGLVPPVQVTHEFESLGEFQTCKAPHPEASELQRGPRTGRMCWWCCLCCQSMRIPLH